MLNRYNAFETSYDGYRLLNAPFASSGTALRDFLRRHIFQGMVIQSVAYGDELTPEQISPARDFAQGLIERQTSYLPTGALAFVGTMVDESFGLVANNYKVATDVEHASVEQQLDMVKAVVVLADCLVSHFQEFPLDESLCNLASYGYSQPALAAA